MKSIRNQRQTGDGKLWNFSYIMILLFSVMSSFSFYNVQTILSKYLINDMGVGVALAGTIVGLFSITSLFCRPFCGILSDRMSRKILLIASSLLMAVGLVGFAFVRSVPGFFVMRILNGIGFAFCSTAQVALSASYIPEDCMGQGIGYMSLSNVLGSAVAPGIGIAIADSFGMKTVFLISAGQMLIGCVFLCLIREKKKNHAAHRSIALRDIIELRVWPLALCGGMFSFASGMISAYILVFSEARGIGDIALYFTVYAVALFLIRPVSGRLMDRYGMKVTVLPAVVIGAISMIVLACSQSLVMILVSSVLRAMGQGAGQPALQAGCINEVGKERSGVATSTYYLFGDVGQGFGPMLGGVLLASVAGVQGYQLLFCICAGMLLLGGVILICFR